MDPLGRPYEPYHTHAIYTLTVTLLAWLIVPAYSRRRLLLRPDLRVALAGLVIALPLCGELGSYLLTWMRPAPASRAGQLLLGLHRQVLRYFPLDPLLDFDIPPGDWAIATTAMLGIVGISLLRWLHGQRQLRSLLTGARPLGQVADAQLTTRLQHLATSACRSLPPILVLELPMPLACTIGILHPRIYVAEQLLGDLTPEELLAVLCHEWAHVLRRDLLWNWLVRLLRDLTCFLPGSHMLWRAMLCSQDEACDALAVRLTGQPLALARALVKVAEAWQSVPQTRAPEASLFTSPKHSPRPRVEQMLRLHADAPYPRAPGAYLMLAALLLLSVLPVLLGC